MCRICGHIKDIDKFNFSKGKFMFDSCNEDFQPFCKECEKDMDREMRQLK